MALNCLIELVVEQSKQVDTVLRNQEEIKVQSNEHFMTFSHTE